MVVKLLVVMGADVAAGEDFFQVVRELGVNRHHILEEAVLGALLHHHDLAFTLDDGGLDLADFFVHQNFKRQFAVENLLADFRDTLRAEGVRGARPAERRLGLLEGLEQRLVGPLGRRGRVGMDPVEPVKHYPRALGGDGNSFLYVLHWLAHVVSLSTAGCRGKTGAADSLGLNAEPGGCAFLELHLRERRLASPRGGLSHLYVIEGLRGSTRGFRRKGKNGGLAVGWRIVWM